MRESENYIYRAPAIHLFIRLYPVCKVHNVFINHKPTNAIKCRVVTDNWHVQN